MLTLFGYVLALLMGFTLGLIGAGGSILTVPILVYFFRVPVVTATGYSLLVVGSAALLGAYRYWRRGQVDFISASLFTLPAMLSVLITRTFIVPSLPLVIDLGFFLLSKDTLILVLFSLLMLLASVFMLRPQNVQDLLKPKAHDTMRLPKLVLGSAGIGLLTGLVGAGGGFLIIPTLIGLFRLTVKQAIGTSLAIIAVNSLVGFKGDIAAGIAIDWSLLGVFLLLTLLGMLAGTSFASKLDASRLRSIFGWFVMLVAIIMLGEQLAHSAAL